MKRKSLILLVTLVAVALALRWRANARAEPGFEAVIAAADSGQVPVVAATSAESSTRVLPRMVELGSDACASCKAMMPVLDELRREDGEALDVEFIDVWKHPEEAERFGIRLIPTQVFLGPDGSELARHEGFFAVDGIRARLAELGFPLDAGRDTQ